MKELTLEANAKVNFTLDVLGKLPNGYHTVRMVMQAVSLHDDVTVQLDGSGKISLRCSLPYLPSDQSNLAWRAAQAARRMPQQFCGHWTRCTAPG